MPKFEVRYKTIEIYYFEIEAEDEESAIEKAEGIMETDEKYDYHDDSNSEVNAYEID